MPNPVGRPKNRSRAGRKPVVTEAVVQKLEQAFLLGCTDAEACLAANISTSTLYNYCEKNPAFLERKEILKQNPLWKARGVVLEAIEDEKNPGRLQAAQELLKRKEGSKVAVTGSNGGPIQVQEVRRTIVDPQHTDS